MSSKVGSSRKRTASVDPESTSQLQKKRKVALKENQPDLPDGDKQSNKSKSTRDKGGRSTILSPHSPTPTLSDDDTQHRSVSNEDTEQVIVHASQSSATAVDQLLSKVEDESPREDEVARLTKELATKNAILEQHQTTFATLQAALQCQICMEVLTDPYITSCGHTACVGCLQEWFRAPPPSAGEGDPPLAPHLRRKTCPTCRAPLRMRPVPFFLVKSMIGIVSPHFDPETAETFAQRGVRIVPGGGDPPDPWAGIFPLDMPRERENPHARGFIVDHGDGGILRCEDCLHEIFDGVCQGCGRMFRDENGDLVYDVDAEGSVADGDVDHYNPAALWDAPIIDEWAASDDEDDEGSDGDSFIDDEGAFNVHVGDGGVIAHFARFLEGNHHHHHHHHPHVIEDEVEVEEIEEDTPPRNRRRHIQWVDSESDNDSNGSDIEEIAARERELYGEDDFVSNRQDERPQGREMNHSIVVLSSDDEDSSESDVPLRRQRIRRILSDDELDIQEDRHSLSDGELSGRDAVDGDRDDIYDGGFLDE